MLSLKLTVMNRLESLFVIAVAERLSILVDGSIRNLNKNHFVHLLDD